MLFEIESNSENMFSYAEDLPNMLSGRTLHNYDLVSKFDSKFV